GGNGSGTFAIVVSGDGVSMTPGPVPHGLPVIDSVVAAESTGQRDIRTADLPSSTEAEASTPIRVLTDPVQVRDGRIVYLQVVGDRTAEQQTLQVLIVVLVVG